MKNPAAAIEIFLNNKKDIMLDRMEKALREISKMNIIQRALYASDLADKTLGIGKYWNK